MNVSCAWCGQPLADDNCPDECSCGGTAVWQTAGPLSEWQKHVVLGLVAPVSDWSSYLKCPVCREPAGAACVAAHAAVEQGRPVGGKTPLGVPHSRRRRRGGLLAR